MGEDSDVAADPISCGCGVAVLVIMVAIGAAIAMVGAGIAWRIVSRAYSWAF